MMLSVHHVLNQASVSFVRIAFPWLDPLAMHHITLVLWWLAHAVSSCIRTQLLDLWPTYILAGHRYDLYTFFITLEPNVPFYSCRNTSLKS